MLKVKRNWLSDVTNQVVTHCDSYLNFLFIATLLPQIICKLCEQRRLSGSKEIADAALCDRPRRTAMIVQIMDRFQGELSIPW